VTPQQSGGELSEGLDRLRKHGAGIVRGGNPQRGAQCRSVEQPGGRFRIHRPDRALVDERLDRLRRRAQRISILIPDRACRG
jgi:hypothetical protein